jgi:hypothetical protein
MIYFLFGMIWGKKIVVTFFKLFLKDICEFNRKMVQILFLLHQNDFWPK